MPTKPLSTIRNSPRLSLGLPSDRNRPYHRETVKDFIGKNSPRLTSYRPSTDLIKAKVP